MRYRKEWERGKTAERGYGSQWRKQRLTFLKANPLCVFCLKRGVVTAANVVDHKVPHQGDQELFWDVSNWQSLCKKCHDSDKQKMELGTYKEFGADGWPIE
jgi:5-methylcytosine-specific restriction endonuclease McrA